MPGSTNPPIHYTAGGQAPLHLLAERLLALRAGDSVDLRHVTVLVPESQAIPRLQQTLQRHASDQGMDALLAPQICTLSAWLNRHVPTDRPVLNNIGRELLLVEALQAHPMLFNQADPWGLAGDLLALFDDLTRHSKTLPAEPEVFTAQLAQAYGIRGEVPVALSQEARIVHTLWHAWQAQLDAEECLDSVGAYLRQLHDSHDLHADADYFVIAGFDAFSDREWLWAEGLLSRRRAELILQLPLPPSTMACGTSVLAQRLAERLPGGTATPAHADTLRRIFATTPSLHERARACARAHPQSALQDRLRILRATNSEQEAQAVDLQVRIWLLAGYRDIGIVTEDRRLARRVRALLQRAGISLQDQAGWALSTTRAAATLERWLQCVEEDFAQQPLLDLLKSPGVLANQDQGTLTGAVYRLEQDIIRHENIERGLDRYRQHLRYRQHRLQAWDKRMFATLEDLFDQLTEAAAPLQQLRDGQAHAPLEYLQALRSSLQLLGMDLGLASDPAGERILDVLDQLPASLDRRSLRMDWQGWRDFLGRCLEQHNFQPAPDPGPVRLINLAQSRLAGFDAVIIAGADRDHLPGGAPQAPFFNRKVRRELGLPGWAEQQALTWSRTYCLLENTAQVLFTYTGEIDGEARPASPWLALIQAFHQCAYAHDLHDSELSRLLEHDDAHVREGDQAPLPLPTPAPAPAVSAEHLPAVLSAAMHQSLIDCPYQFFAGEYLGLKPLEEIRLALEKSDYGQRVHRCLEAFHIGASHPHLTAFTDPVTAANRDLAIQHLNRISVAVFRQDLEDNFLHRAWLRRWQLAIPAYIDWQIGRAVDWRVSHGEQRTERALSPTLALKGRLDRIDNRDGQFAVLDYKTGKPPGEQEVLSGEAVQLTTYSLLQDDCVRVEYLQIDKDKVKSSACIEGETLDDLKLTVRLRLEQLHAALRDGQAMPAWGDATSCAQCNMDGVCRREAWLI